MNAETFNSLHPVGTLVFAYPGARPEDIPSTRRLVTRTRTVAQSVGLDREGVVWVDGHGAYIALTHVDMVSEAEWEAAKLADAVAAEGALPMPAGAGSRQLADLRERREAADILDRAADHIAQFGLDDDRHVLGAIAAAAYGDPAASVAAQGGAPDRARARLFWRLGVKSFIDSLLPTVADAEKALRDTATDLRAEATS